MSQEKIKSEGDQVRQDFKRFLAESSRRIDCYFAIVDMGIIRRKFHQNLPELERILSTSELEYLKRFPMPKKKIQWISGRHAIKAALFKYKAARGRILDLSCIDILNGVNSAPYPVQFPNIRITITHSFPYCIGVASEYRIGVDLERIISPRSSLLEHYYHPHEIIELQSKTGTDQYNIQATTYWTRKEAVSKLLGLGLKMDFKEIDTICDLIASEKYNTQRIRLNSCAVSDFCLSLAVEEVF